MFVLVLNSSNISAYQLTLWITHSLSFCFISENFLITEEIVGAALESCSNWGFTMFQLRLST
jgi:hypothetical protein